MRLVMQLFIIVLLLFSYDHRVRVKIVQLVQWRSWQNNKVMVLSIIKFVKGRVRRASDWCDLCYSC